MTIDLTTETFTNFINTAERPVLVHYWAEWSRASKNMALVLGELSEQWADRVLFARVNVDEHEALASGLSTIPTIRLYSNGHLLRSLVGEKPLLLVKDDLALYLL